MSKTKLRLAVVIPCYKEQAHVLEVIAGIPEDVTAIYCVDDACPDGTGDWINEHCKDPRVRVLMNAQNLGVGGAVLEGYRAALADDSDIVVKLDGDGQMDPALISSLIAPILNRQADYTKGNRFFQLDFLSDMPTSRILGNAGLSILTKLSSGYWNIFDPTNGFTAIHASALKLLPLEKISQRYFFESDMLFRLGTIRAVVQDVPQKAVYQNETSHLNIWRSIPEFAWKHIKNITKRIFYNYFLRDFSVASLQLLLGPAMVIFGLLFGLSSWWENSANGVATPTGTIMIVTISLIMGTQFLLSALNFDLMNQPKTPLQTLMGHAG